MIGRRVKSLDELQQPGDYCRLKESVWFILPVELDDESIPIWARPTTGDPFNGRHRIAQFDDGSGWTFRECTDGSLEARPSIGCGVQPYYWHGYLDEGHHWRRV
jgi:hypothetical protein